MQVTESITTPPWRDASPSQVYPHRYVAVTHLYIQVKRDNVQDCRAIFVF